MMKICDFIMHVSILEKLGFKYNEEKVNFQEKGDITICDLYRPLMSYSI